MKFGGFTSVKGDPVYIDERLAYNLLHAKKNAKTYKGDLIIIIDGEEGSGKSTKARQVAKFLDPTFTEDRIAFRSAECKDMHFKGKKWEAIILDESKEDLDRKTTMSIKNRAFMNFLSQSRQAHKFLIVVLPSIFDLDKYVAEHRAKMLIHTYKYRGRRPGYFTFYGRRGIKRLFAYGQKNRGYPVKASFNGIFTKAEVVDLDRYDKFKWNAFAKYQKTLVLQKTEDEIIRDYRKTLIDRFYELKVNWSDGQIALMSEVLGIHKTTVSKMHNEDKKKPTPVEVIPV